MHTDSGIRKRERPEVSRMAILIDVSTLVIPAIDIAAEGDFPSGELVKAGILRLLESVEIYGKRSKRISIVRWIMTCS